MDRLAARADDTLTDLVRRAAEDDQNAWDTIVERYTPLVWHVARGFRLEGDQCADAVQDTWSRLVQYIGRIRDPTCLPGWLVTTTRNNCLATMRRNDKDRAATEECARGQVAEAGPEEQLLRFECRAQVVQAFRRLPSRDQDLLGMLIAEPPVPYREISRRLEIPIGSIGPTRRRALTRLRDELHRVTA